MYFTIITPVSKTHGAADHAIPLSLFCENFSPTVLQNIILQKSHLKTNHTFL